MGRENTMWGREKYKNGREKNNDGSSSSSTWLGWPAATAAAGVVVKVKIIFKLKTCK